MSAFQVLTETNAISVAILNVKIAATIGLVADITRDLHAPRLEFSIERISIVDPNVGVPRPALRINDVIRAHRSSGFQLSQHDDDAVALDHTKRRWVVPETFIMEAKFVAVVVCGADHVIDDEVRGTGPPLAVLHDVVAHYSLAIQRLLSATMKHPACLAPTSDPQLTACFTSAPIFVSAAAVNSFSAKATGQRAPSSRFASSLKPNVAYLDLNFCALWK